MSSTRDVPRRQLKFEGELYFLHRFYVASQREHRIRRFINDELSQREEIMQEYFGWWQWYFAEFVVGYQDLFAQAALTSTLGLLTTMVIELCECRARLFSLWNGNLWQTMHASSIICGTMLRIGGSELASSAMELSDEYHRNIGSFLLIGRVVKGFRKRVALMTGGSIEVDRRYQAAARLHAISRGFFVRSVLRSASHSKIWMRRLAARPLLAVFRGYRARWSLYRDAAEPHLGFLAASAQSLGILQHVETQRRSQLMRDEKWMLTSLRCDTERNRATRASRLIHRVVSGFVTRVDLCLWIKFGNSPLVRVCPTRQGGSKHLRELSQALDWHLMSQRHQLWEGSLCDALV